MTKLKKIKNLISKSKTKKEYKNPVELTELSSNAKDKILDITYEIYDDNIFDNNTNTDGIDSADKINKLMNNIHDEYKEKLNKWQQGIDESLKDKIKITIKPDSIESSIKNHSHFIDKMNSYSKAFSENIEEVDKYQNEVEKIIKEKMDDEEIEEYKDEINALTTGTEKLIVIEKKCLELGIKAISYLLKDTEDALKVLLAAS